MQRTIRHSVFIAEVLILVGVLAFTLKIGSVYAGLAAVVTSPFVYTFNSTGRLKEAGDAESSTSPYWWLNSGAYMHLAGGVGKTIQGSLPALDVWRLIYAVSNPLDTDNGYRPQNIFRLFTRSGWHNAQQSAYLNIKNDNMSASPSRNGSNGLLLFNRYQSNGDLYYAGVRVDGLAVIKKKKGGTYYTMAYKKIFSGTYDKNINPNLLPHNQWVGIRSEVVNNTGGGATIRLYTDVGKTGAWKLVLSAIDDGQKYGGAAIAGSGAGGIRTDFMDVEFDDYKFVNL